MQSESKSMEHARRIAFATVALMPLGGKPEELWQPIAKHPQDGIAVRSLNISQPIMEKLQLNPFATTFATICPFPEKCIYQTIWV
jgi:hypothetical protein